MRLRVKNRVIEFSRVEIVCKRLSSFTSVNELLGKHFKKVAEFFNEIKEDSYNVLKVYGVTGYSYDEYYLYFKDDFKAETELINAFKDGYIDSSKAVVVIKKEANYNYKLEDVTGYLLY